MGILTARPRPPSQAVTGGPETPGLHQLGLGGKRDGLLRIPHGYRADRPGPLIVLLHGAGAGAPDILPILDAEADAQGIVLLVPESRGTTWDVILGDYGPDVAFIDHALERVFARLRIDPERIAVSGFSDGASYALSLGIANGDLFKHVLAFSPGFMAPTRREGTPDFFISHGVDDPVLPIDKCSRPIVARLKAAGYRVRYREFAGGHTVPPEIAREAVEWFLDAGEPSRGGVSAGDPG
jgi:predicted esterase